MAAAIDWDGADFFEIRIEDRRFYFPFVYTDSRVYLAKHDRLKITVEGDTLRECCEAAEEALELLFADMREEGEDLPESDEVP